MEKHEKGSKKHITSFDRFKILKYLSLGFNIPKIAMILGFNKTSIYREIILNSVVENKHPQFGWGFKTRLCKNASICGPKISRCPEVCMKYLPKTCSLITKPYEVCNFCERIKECKFEHLIYHPEVAHDAAKKRFKNGKTKIKLDETELRKFDKYVSTLIINGQSPEAVKSYSSNKDFPVCSKTLRSYIDKGLLTAKNIDLRRKLSITTSNNYNYPRSYSHDPLKKIDHLYDDYLTIHADTLHFQMYILLLNKTALRVNNAFLAIRNKLGKERFSKVFRVLLSDNGTEFDNLTELEHDIDGEIMCRVFYTRTYRSSDKAECERNHELFRYIRKKGKTLDTIDEEDIEIINSHINSYPRKSLDWKTPIEAMKEKFGNDIVKLLGIEEIKRKDVNLTARVMKQK